MEWIRTCSQPEASAVSRQSRCNRLPGRHILVAVTVTTSSCSSWPISRVWSVPIIRFGVDAPRITVQASAALGGAV